jgi:hypothetical protein
MIKKRDVVLFLAALALGLAGRAVWRLGRPAAAPASASGPGGASLPSDLSTPDSSDKGLFASLFSRPSGAIAPVDVPALSAPAPERFGEKTPSTDETWASRATGPGALGESGGMGSSAPPPAPGSGGTGGAPQWQTPPSGGGSSASSGPSSLGTFPSGSGSAAAPRQPSTPSMRALKRLGKRVAGYGSAAVDLSGGHVGPSIAAPGSSPAGAPGGPFGVPDPSVAAAQGAGAAPAQTAAAAAPSSGGDGGSPAALGSSSGGDAGLPSGDAGAAPTVAVPDASSATVDDGTGGDPDAQQVADLTPSVGSPQVSNGANGVTLTPSGFFFAGVKGMGATVQTMNLQAGPYKGVEFTSDLYVDPNGAGGWYIKDKTGRATTALKYSKTESLNPGKIPYIVIPRKFKDDYPNVKLGDYAAVSYGGKTLYAIIGDLGPPGVLGGGSISLAVGLGMDPTPKTGGAAGGVTYVILAGTRDRTPPRDAETIQSEGQQLFARAGIPIN